MAKFCQLLDLSKLIFGCMKLLCRSSNPNLYDHAVPFLRAESFDIAFVNVSVARNIRSYATNCYSKCRLLAPVLGLTLAGSAHQHLLLVCGFMALALLAQALDHGWGHRHPDPREHSH